MGPTEGWGNVHRRSISRFGQPEVSAAGHRVSLPLYPMWFPSISYPRALLFAVAQSNIIDWFPLHPDVLPTMTPFLQYPF